MPKRKWEINCYEAMPDGSLVIYLEDEKCRNDQVVIEPHDVERMMCAGIDALQKKPSRR